MVLEFSYFDTKIKKQRPGKNAVNLSEPITFSIIYCEKAKDRKERRKKNWRRKSALGVCITISRFNASIFAQPLSEKKEKKNRQKKATTTTAAPYIFTLICSWCEFFLLLSLRALILFPLLLLRIFSNINNSY